MMCNPAAGCIWGIFFKILCLFCLPRIINCYPEEKLKSKSAGLWRGEILNLNVSFIFLFSVWPTCPPLNNQSTSFNVFPSTIHQSLHTFPICALKKPECKWQKSAFLLKWVCKAMIKTGLVATSLHEAKLVVFEKVQRVSIHLILCTFSICALKKPEWKSGGEFWSSEKKPMRK